MLIAQLSHLYMLSLPKCETNRMELETEGSFMPFIYAGPPNISSSERKVFLDFGKVLAFYGPKPLSC